MRARIGRQEEGSDDAVAPDRLSGHADARSAPLQGEPAGRAVRGARLELDEPGLHHDARRKRMDVAPRLALG
jgi:hypothetical protein